ncbi:MAG: hypothetical protein IPJ65_03005 [Archangiaceae bacterium]|nr:hypothetical protein [Archangiaceae bacterium]
MSRILVAVLAFSVLGYLAYRTMYGSRPPEAVEAPTDRLQDAKKAANRIEKQGEQRVDDLDQKARE